MADENKDREQPPPHYEGGIPVLPGPAERENASRHAEKEEERQYRQNQTAIQRGIYKTQIALVFFGILGMGVSAYQAWTARISANQAIISADQAKRSVALAEDNATTSQSQFDRTMHQMIGQTASTIRSSNAAKSAAETAADALRN